MAESNQPTPAQLAAAYLAVFGRPDNRTQAQALVWRDMESFCHAYRLSVEVVAGGNFSENNVLVNEGRRSYWLRARGQILAAQAPAAEPLKVNRRAAKP